jgi:hypothetical protein
MTKAVLTLLLVGLVSTSIGQAQSDLFEKAPPGVEEALRDRVGSFYNTWKEGKFRAGEKFVAEDAQDIYYGMPKQKFEWCEIIKIKFEREFNDAMVTVQCKGKWNFQGQELDTTVAHTDFWTLEKDLWVWTVKPVKTTESPFGNFSYGNIDNAHTLFNPDTGMPKDVKALGQSILKQVSADKQEVQLSGSEKSSAVVTIKNGLTGYIDIEAVPDAKAPAGFLVSLDNAKVPGNGEAKVLITFDPTDKSAKKGTRVMVRVQQTSQIFPIAVTFSAPEEPREK